jgi:hypothetical protein
MSSHHHFRGNFESNQSRKNVGLRNVSQIQGCQMVCFQTEKSNLGKFWRVLPWNMAVYFMDTWSILQSLSYILWTFGIVRGNLVYFFPLWYFAPRKFWQPCCTNRRQRSLSDDGVVFFSRVTCASLSMTNHRSLMERRLRRQM